MLYIIGALNDNLAVYLTIMPVGADAHIGPNRHRFWADVGIGPYNCVVYGSTLNDNLSKKGRRCGGTQRRFLAACRIWGKYPPGFTL